MSKKVSETHPPERHMSITNEMRWIQRPCKVPPDRVRDLPEMNIPRETVLQQLWVLNTRGMSIAGYREWRDVPHVRQSIDDYESGVIPDTGSTDMYGNLINTKEDL